MEHDKKIEHMKRRHQEHGSLKKTAEEFGISKSKLHRIIKKHESEEEDNAT